VTGLFRAHEPAGWREFFFFERGHHAPAIVLLLRPIWDDLWDGFGAVGWVLVRFAYVRTYILIRFSTFWYVSWDGPHVKTEPVCGLR